MLRFTTPMSCPACRPNAVLGGGPGTRSDAAPRRWVDRPEGSCAPFPRE
ncbi:hypothetical protein HGI15_16760 [Modestobacter lapidis]|nr:hypothetical protein [Modestobacter lapidis]